MDQTQRTVRATFISSYIPRKCGIATFTKDLTGAINSLNPDALADIVAVNDNDYYYPWEVKYRVQTDDRASYLAAADYINQSSTDIVSLQHEYGLYGGLAGNYIFDLIDNIEKPLVCTLHTILADPNPSQRAVLRRLIQRSASVVAMVPDARERLERDYGVCPDHVAVIHHGVADRPKSNGRSKRLFRWQPFKVLLITGLLGPDKGAEYVIRALPEITKKVPNALFVLVGETHPHIKALEGERHRSGLRALARRLGVADHIKFINEYVPLERLLAYYDACDVYLTPHLNPGQITSGTLAYALGLGKAIISTPYVYAKEMLSDDRGLLVPFADAAALAKAAIKILTNDRAKAQLEERAYTLGRRMSWPRVAERYLMLFRHVIEQPTVLPELIGVKKVSV